MQNHIAQRMIVVSVDQPKYLKTQEAYEDQGCVHDLTCIQLICAKSFKVKTKDENIMPVQLLHD